MRVCVRLTHRKKRIRRKKKRAPAPRLHCGRGELRDEMRESGRSVCVCGEDTDHDHSIHGIGGGGGCVWRCGRVCVCVCVLFSALAAGAGTVSAFLEVNEDGVGSSSVPFSTRATAHSINALLLHSTSLHHSFVTPPTKDAHTHTTSTLVACLFVLLQGL